MRTIVTLLSLLLLGVAGIAHDYYLLPEDFFLKPGDYLKVHLLVGDDFVKEFERNYQATKTVRFELIDKFGTTDLAKITQDSAAPIINYRLKHTGLALINLTRNASMIEQKRDKFIAYLKEEGITNMEPVLSKNTPRNITERYTRYVKTLVKAGNAGGDFYKRDLHNELEILLLNNPYAANVGGVISAAVKFKGKALPNAAIDVLRKTADEKITPLRLTTNALGHINFPIGAKGIYLIRLVHMEQAVIAGADFESWWASYTFAVE